MMIGKVGGVRPEKDDRRGIDGGQQPVGQITFGLRYIGQIAAQPPGPAFRRAAAIMNFGGMTGGAQYRGGPLGQPGVQRRGPFAAQSGNKAGFGGSRRGIAGE